MNYGKHSRFRGPTYLIWSASSPGSENQRHLTRSPWSKGCDPGTRTYHVGAPTSGSITLRSDRSSGAVKAHTQASRHRLSTSRVSSCRPKRIPARIQQSALTASSLAIRAQDRPNTVRRRPRSSSGMAIIMRLDSTWMGSRAKPIDTRSRANLPRPRSTQWGPPYCITTFS